MKLSPIITAFLTELEKSAVKPKQVEPYEGQFEDLRNFTIQPPAIFVDMPSGGYSNQMLKYKRAEVVLYVFSSSLHSNDQTIAMLDIIDTISDEIMTSKILPTKKITYNGFEKLGNFPGLKVYQMNFTIS